MRRVNDYYPSSCHMRRVLGDFVDVSGTVAEPCVGSGDLLCGDELWTNDIDERRQATYHLDASKWSSWELFQKVDWVITNPPFDVAFEILRLANARAVKGVALVLRLSFLEPTEQRRDYLINNPPKKVIVMPRYSFTADGKTDNVTCAWMVWGDDVEPGVHVAGF